MKKIISLTIGALLFCSPLFAQKKDKKDKASGTQASTQVKADTTKKKGGLQAYKQLINAKAKTRKGLFTTHKINEDYYFEIADSIIGREFIAVTRISKAPTGGGYGGEEENRQVLRWERGPNNKLFLRAALYINTSPDSTKPIQQAVRNSNLEPIAAAFEIKSIRKDTSVVINVTDFFKGDNQLIALDPSTKRQFNLTTLQADRSYIQSIKSFPINTEVKMVKTYTSVTPPPSLTPSPFPTTVLPAGSNTGVVTMEINSSMILLPKIPARKRLFDNRIGFFATGYTVYGEQSQRSETEIFAVRWRLEPKASDIEKMKRGELVEPKKPIVFYIDPATPVQWRKYLKLGIEDWQKAFEQAGFKNAILSKEVAPGDTTISTEDARYSFIRYFASDIQNAYGPNVNDPRTGEILESHIGWYHNVMNLLNNWYTIQTGAADPRSRKKKFDDALMGELVRFVASHEVGHTLGLRHNFGSSYATPVEKLRDKNYLATTSHTASIMDYARFNYVAQPEDGVTNFFPGIGTYDKWAIEWGYRWMPDFKTGEEEVPMLQKMVTERLKNKRLWFGTEQNPDDPRSQSEDLGNDAMKAGMYGIKNLQRIVPNLLSWTKQPNETYEGLDEMYNQIQGQFGRYMGHVAKNIGGIYETPKMNEQDGAVYEYTPKATQKEAMNFIGQQLFTTPTWLINNDIFSRTGENSQTVIGIRQESILNRLVNSGTMSKLFLMESTLGSNAYKATDLMDDLRRTIFSELVSKKATDVYRRNLQKMFVERIISLLPGGAAPFSLGSFGITFQITPSLNIKNTDAYSILKGTLRTLRSDIRLAIPTTTDVMTKLHLQDLNERITMILEPK